jgi:hypothetical protein
MQLPDLQFWLGVLVPALLAVITAFVVTVPPFDHFGGIALALIAGVLTVAEYRRLTRRLSPENYLFRN